MHVNCAAKKLLTLAADAVWGDTERREFVTWIEELQKGFGEHDSDHLP